VSCNSLAGLQSIEPKGEQVSLSKILIPVDGSPASLRAVDFAIEMVAQDPSTSLVLLHVQNTRAIELAGASEAMDTEWLREAGSRASAKALKDAIGKCEHAGVASEALVRTGQIAEAVGQVAREENVKHYRNGHSRSWWNSRPPFGLGRHAGCPFGRSSNHADQVDGSVSHRDRVVSVTMRVTSWMS
jgi:hypothetical protein